MTDARLYSRDQRLPRDTIAPEHQAVHVDCERWGAWNRERYQQGRCRSIEHRYDDDGGRKVKRPTVALAPDPMLRRIEVAVVALMQTPATEHHGETLREYYARRWALKTICWAHAIRYEDFGRWIYDCRQAVLNLLASELRSPP